MRLPFFKQRTNEYCGPAVLAMILRAHGIYRTQDQLAREAGTTFETGTSIKGLVSTLQKHGFTVNAKQRRSIKDLQRALSRDQIVIVCFTERKSQWGHYAIVRAIKGSHIVLIDPAEHLGRHAPFTLKEFDARWCEYLYTHTNHWAAFVS
jgi:ABC-type bacteriocin/lantibiotic exporter with double-glycine peptidase domain